MRVMYDTNVLISMIFFESKRLTSLLEKTVSYHTLVLSSYVLNELIDVTERKFPKKKKAVESFITSLSYEYVYVPQNLEDGLFEIRDKNDYPVLYAAVVEDVDVFVTGDKDFLDVSIDKPEILTPTDFLEKYL